MLSGNLQGLILARMMKLTLVATVTSLLYLYILIQPSSSRCPNEWKPFGCSCYRFFEQRLTWNSAKEICKKENAELAIITEMKENNFIGQNIKTQSWIGLRREANTTSPFENLSYSVWDKTITVTSKPECVATKPTQRRIWKAQSCTEKFSYICEISGVGTCPNDGKWVKSNKSCYHLSTTPLSFIDAKKACKDRQSHLAEISTREENDFVLTQLLRKNGRTVVMFGLEKPVNQSTFKYSNSSTEPDYSAIGVVLSSSNIHVSSCVTTYPGTYNAVWVQDACDETKSYICEANRDFELNVSNVNETFAYIDWRMQQSVCNESSRYATYELSVRQHNNNEAIKIEKIDWHTGRTAITELKPATGYVVTLIRKLNGQNWTSIASFKTTEIKNPLRVMRNLSSVSMKIGLDGIATLLCVAKGEPPITFSWTKDSKSLRSFGELKQKFPSSVLVMKIRDEKSFGKYICRIRDRFSEKFHEILVEELPEDDSEDGLLTATIILAIFLALLILIVGYLAYRLYAKQSVEVTKPSQKPNELGNDETYVNVPRNGQVDVTNNLELAESVSYTSLKRADNESQEDNFYTHLNERIYENTS